MRGWFATAVALMVAVSLQASEQGSVPRGWGVYRLGMTEEQVLAVPGSVITAKAPYCSRKQRLRNICPPIEHLHLRTASRAVVGGNEFAIQLTIENKRLRLIDRGAHPSMRLVTVKVASAKRWPTWNDVTGVFSPGSLGSTTRNNPAKTAVQYGSSTYAHWTWDESMIEFMYTGATQRLNVWSAKRGAGGGSVEIRATLGLHYKISERSLLAPELPHRLGDCQMRVRYGGPLSPAKGPAGRWPFQGKRF